MIRNIFASADQEAPNVRTDRSGISWLQDRGSGVELPDGVNPCRIQPHHHGTWNFARRQ